MQLKNKNVVITGANKGIGAAIAKAFARENCKLQLVCPPTASDDMKKVESECQGACASCECITCDLSDMKQCDQLCNKLSSVDVLVNNAGIFGPSAAEEQGPLKGNPDEWAKVINTNLTSVMRLTRHLAPKMVEKGSPAVIINIGDVEGLHTAPQHAVYAASKAGLRSFSLSCYEKLRDKNVSVVHIAAGNVEGTDMVSAKEGGQGSMTAEDVAEACLFVFRLSDNCVPEEIVLKAMKSGTASA